ncbi:hypothetical protein LCGC14_1984410, partial [marine sediment metagenome]
MALRKRLPIGSLFLLVNARAQTST